MPTWPSRPLSGPRGAACVPPACVPPASCHRLWKATSPPGPIF